MMMHHHQPPSRRWTTSLFLCLLLVAVTVVGGSATTPTTEDTANSSNSNNLRGGEASQASQATTTTTKTSTTTRVLQDAKWNYQLDGRWKSTKISDECKKRLGIHKPDDYVDPNEADIQVVDSVEEEAIEVAIIDEEKDAEDQDQIAAANAAVAASSKSNSGSSSVDPGGIEGVIEGTKNRRKFVSYEPSQWEEGWLEGIADMVQSKSICQTLVTGKLQTANTHAFLNMICTARSEQYPDWCYYHDHNHFLWYNTRNTDTFQVYLDRVPMSIQGVTAPEVKPVVIDPEKYPDIASKFTFLDETTGEEYVEYIEPLVAQLRFPLTECLIKKKMPLLAEFASYIIPPPNADRVNGRTILFDLGSPDWSRMEYVVEEWLAHGTDFKYMISYSATQDQQKDAFLTSIPDQHAQKIFRHYLPLVDHPVDDPAKEGLFIPSKIKDMAAPDDYIVLKLDKGNGSMKQKMVQYLLDNDDVHVDELLWEIDASGNYVMESYFDKTLGFSELSSLSLPEAYSMLLKLRQKGIRAHSWI